MPQLGGAQFPSSMRLPFRSFRLPAFRSFASPLAKAASSSKPRVSQRAAQRAYQCALVGVDRDTWPADEWRLGSIVDALREGGVRCLRSQPAYFIS